MENPIEVTLISPAKIAGKHERAGRTLSVSSTIAIQLAATGAIASADLGEIDLQVTDQDGISGIDAGKIALEEGLKLVTEQRDAAFGEIEELKDVRDILTAALTHAEAEVAELQSNRDTLAGEIANADLVITELRAALAPKTSEASDEKTATSEPSAAPKKAAKPAAAKQRG
jgi:septal ring factor EnvC (AmiA/AmiB activator)